MKSILISAIIGFFALIVYALFLQPMGEGFSIVFSNIWGTVIIADLYLGFLVFSLLIFKTERSALKAFGWIGTLCIIGNPIAAIYVLKILFSGRRLKMN